MQRKYSEVVNYMPSFATFEFRRNNNREPTNNQKNSPIEGYRPSHSPSVHPSQQYSQQLAPTQLVPDNAATRNSSFEGGDRRSLPNFNGKVQVPQPLNSPIIDPRGGVNNGFRGNVFLDPNQLQRRATQQNLSSEPIQQYSSPQNLGRFSQLEPQQIPDPIKRNLMTSNTSPIKMEPFSMNINNQASKYVKPIPQPHINRVPPPLHIPRQNGKASQSMIFPQTGSSPQYQRKVGDLNSVPLLRNINNNNSDLESTFSSDNSGTTIAEDYSPMLSDQINQLRKPNYRKNQEVWKSSAQFTLMKSSNLQSTPNLNGLDSNTSIDFGNRKQINNDFINRKEMSNQKKIIAVQPYKFQEKDKPVPFALKTEQPAEDVTKLMDFKFRKKNDFNTASSSVVDLKDAVKAKQKQMKSRFTINDFEVIQKLGKGAYGDVFLAREKLTKFLCVLKTLSKKKIKQLNLEQLVFRQIKIQSFLAHRHVTTLYGFFEDQTKIYLIMECMPDGSMSSNGKKKITENETAHLVYQVLDGLNYMHREDIIHRDIKPQNLLLNNNYLKIGDFGCAVFGNTLRRTVVGCYAYISPQQFSNNPYDQKIDSWSVGILAYELLTGKPPYQQKLRKLAVQNQNQSQGQNDNQNSIQNTSKIQFSDLTFPKDIKLSTDAVDFIKRLLDPDPATRADIKQALKHKFMQKAKEYEKYLQSQL